MNTQSVNNRILEFIAQHHVLTLATSTGEVPWCASCFYVYLPERNVFIFTSDDDTRHAQEMLGNPKVAGTIVLETGIVGRIRGLQFTGCAQVVEGKAFEDARKAYIKRFPIAIAVRLRLWELRPDYFKMTDNRLGFGKKLIWSAQDQECSNGRQ